ncbi:MAG: hypothetical protein LHV69_07290 [Elusimicrobia bacterium]|nr:hypothetical protein [Candidatus Obscuribacterium magneticum]
MKKFFFFVTVCAGVFASGRIFGSELLSSADVMESKSWALSFYGTRNRAEPVVRNSNVDAIQVPVSGGSETIFSDANTDVEMESDYSAAVAAVTLRPHDGFHYRFKAGQIRDYELEYSSGNVTNRLRSQSSGLLWGVGVRWNFQPQTIVSAGMAIDLSYTQTLANLDRFESGGTVERADIRFEQDEFQGALNVSRRWKTWEPYGGVKVAWVSSQMKDGQTQERIKGTDQRLSPFLGLRWEAFPGESVVVEGSFYDEESLSAGMTIKF